MAQSPLQIQFSWRLTLWDYLEISLDTAIIWKKILLANLRRQFTNLTEFYPWNILKSWVLKKLHEQWFWGNWHDIFSISICFYAFLSSAFSSMCCLIWQTFPVPCFTLCIFQVICKFPLETWRNLAFVSRLTLKSLTCYLMCSAAGIWQAIVAPAGLDLKWETDLTAIEEKYHFYSSVMEE